MFRSLRGTTIAEFIDISAVVDTGSSVRP